jgi:hypothetical protein
MDRAGARAGVGDARHRVRTMKTATARRTPSAEFRQPISPSVGMGHDWSWVNGF